jgi:NADPH2:quinone reductase
MRAFVLQSFDTQPHHRDDLPEPELSAGKLIVRVRASSVNPVDVFIAAGMLRDSVAHEFPVTLGRDFAGVVEQIGDGVSRFGVGDEVFGFLPHAAPAVHDGSWAELIAVPEDNYVAAKPAGADLQAAGAAPLAAITALAGFDGLSVSAGETVLVVGATGGVGSFFVQLAADAGAHVIAPAFPEDEEYLRELGVDEVIPRAADLESTVRKQHTEGVDAILDLVSFAPDASLLKAGGRLASPLGAAGDGPGRSNVMAQPTPENLTRLARLVDAGTLRVPIQGQFPLAEAGDALSALQTSHTQGKIALVV